MRGLFLWDVVVFSPQDVWIVGGNAGGLTFHWDGTDWRKVPNPTDSPRFGRYWLYSLSALSSREIWVGGTFLGGAGVEDRGVVMRWDGAEWKDMGLPRTGWVYSVLIVSENEGWVGGKRLFHWDGQRWEVAAIPIRDRFVDLQR